MSKYMSGWIGWNKEHNGDQGGEEYTKGGMKMKEISKE